MDDKNFNSFFNQALNFHQKGNLTEALKIYKNLEKKFSNNYVLDFYIGTLFLQLGEFEISKNYLNKSIKNNNTRDTKIYTASLNNLSLISLENKEYEEALSFTNNALKIDSSYFDAILNRAKIFLLQNNYVKSHEDLKKAKKINQNSSEVYNELGNLKSKLSLFEEAIDYYEFAIRLNKLNFYPYHNLGSLYEKIEDYSKSLFYYQKAKQINPNFKYLLGKIFYLKMYLSDWTNYDENYKELLKNKFSFTPFASLAYLEDINLQYQAIKGYVKNEFKKPLEIKTYFREKNKKIKIGYFSSDFRNHATSKLFLDILKNHEHDNFEIYGFYHGPIEKDTIRTDIIRYFKNFYEITNNSDQEICELTKKINIDIAVNMNGYTKFSRNEIFENKLAPIQINYLGFPGTMGVNFIDYIIADRTIIPEKYQKYYTEEVLYLNQCYQPNRDKDTEFESLIKRDELKLPENKFLFCNLNNNFKITPKIFDAWMKILTKTENSYLCLLKSNEQSIINLKKYTEKKGIDSNRLIFLPKLKYEDHLKRYEFMDLFLDSYPYGAHTTSSEAIRSGLPVVTLQGETFASRVASSILTEVGLTSLITNSIDDYIALAIELCSNKSKLNNIKDKLNINLKETLLFNPSAYTRNLEEIYKKIYDKENK